MQAIKQQQQGATLWRVRDVANFFSVRPGTVYKWAETGKIPVRRTPGGQLRFVESEIRAAQPKQEAA